MKGIEYFIGLIALVLLVGIVLRYGNSSHQLLGDFNSFLALLSAQGAPYYGPAATSGRGRGGSF